MMHKEPSAERQQMYADSREKWEKFMKVLENNYVKWSKGGLNPKQKAEAFDDLMKAYDRWLDGR